jgi:hypothetical protein
MNLSHVKNLKSKLGLKKLRPYLIDPKISAENWFFGHMSHLIFRSKTRKSSFGPAAPYR